MFAKVCYGLIALVVAWGLASLFSTIFECVPVEAVWNKDPETLMTAHCIDTRSKLIGINIPNIAADFAIIILPVQVIWQLKLSMLRRTGLTCIFLLAFT